MMEMLKQKINCQLFGLFLILAFLTATASAQTISEGDIIYSRLPAAPSTSGTIWAVRHDGSNDRQIALGSQPRLSPNNRYLIFRRGQIATEPYRFGQLFIRDLTNGSETLLISYSDYLVGYDFTPDSMQIVYDDPRFSGIHKMNLDGTNQIAVGGSSFADDFPVVRTGDNLIAHHRYDSFATSGIYTLTANGATQQLVPNTLNNLYPSWSPNGQFIAFGSGSLFSNHPYLINNLFKIKPGGSGKIPLTNLATNNNFATGFVWTANGAKIIAPANINGVAGLYAINADGTGAPVIIPTTAGSQSRFRRRNCRRTNGQRQLSITAISFCGGRRNERRRKLLNNLDHRRSTRRFRLNRRQLRFIKRFLEFSTIRRAERERYIAIQ